jgi:hypothetical protein
MNHVGKALVFVAVAFVVFEVTLFVLTVATELLCR